MKENGRAILIAVVLSVILPSVVFSIAEKIFRPSVTDGPSETTEATISQVATRPVIPDDHILVQLEDGTIETMNMDDYLTGVLLGEMPADFHKEALKSQAVVARTYAKKRNETATKHTMGAVCTVASCCQAFCAPEDYIQSGGKKETVDRFMTAVAETTGEVLMYQGELIEATYFSCSGGKTEDAVVVWGTEIPYLQSVDSPGEEKATRYTGYIEMSAAEFASRLEMNINSVPSGWLGKVTYTNGGGVDTMMIAGKVFDGVTLREKLGLNSTMFSILVAGDTIHIYTKGFGHRVGMSQYGADAMAVSGKSYVQILAHYYLGTTLDSYLD